MYYFIGILYIFICVWREVRFRMKSYDMRNRKTVCKYRLTCFPRAKYDIVIFLTVFSLIYTHTHAHTHTHIYRYIYIYMCVCVCVCVCVFWNIL